MERKLLLALSQETMNQWEISLRMDGKITVTVNSIPFCYHDKSIGLSVYLHMELMYCQLKCVIISAIIITVIILNNYFD